MLPVKCGSVAGGRQPGSELGAGIWHLATGYVNGIAHCAVRPAVKAKGCQRTRIFDALFQVIRLGFIFSDFLNLNFMSLRLKHLILYWLPLFIFCGFIFIQSSYPSPENVITVALSDQLLHGLAYAVLGILFFRAYGTLPIKNNHLLLIGLSILSAGLFGLSDEIHQYFVPARNADLWDVIADIIGCLSGVFLYQVWMPRKEPD